MVENLIIKRDKWSDFVNYLRLFEFCASQYVISYKDGSVCGRYDSYIDDLDLSGDVSFSITPTNTRLQRVVEEYIGSRASAADSSTSEQSE